MISFKKFITELKDTEDDDIMYENGVYISTSLTIDTEVNLINYIKKHISIIKNVELNYNSLHNTLIYSKAKLKEKVIVKDYTYIATPLKLSLFGENNDILVLELDSPELIKRNNELVEQYNFISDYDEYKPHITLAYKVELTNVDSIPLPNFVLFLTNEQVEKLNTNWSANSDEENEEDKSLNLSFLKLKK